jgi:hypothetical protein
VNIRLLSAGFITAKLFTGQRVIILGYRNVNVSVRKPRQGEVDPPKAWIGPALWLEFEDSSRHHGYAPETIVELTQAYHSITQAREAAFRRIS